MSSLFHFAAYRANPDDAIFAIRAALSMPQTDTAPAMMPDAQSWTRLSAPERLKTIASWLTAECAAVADECATYVTCPDPLDAVGTRD